MSLNIFSPKRKLLGDFTGIFSIRGCGYCRLYCEFIETINLKLPLYKQIKIIDATMYHDYGIITNSLIPIFIKYYKGGYPSFFINGELISGANSVEELKARIIPYFSDYFIIKEDLSTEVDGKEYEWLFDKDCRYVKKGLFGGKLECA